MFRPLLVDVGLSLADVGWLLGVFGMMMTMLGSFSAALLLSRLGRKRSLLIAVSLWFVGILTYLLPTFGFTQAPVLYCIVSSIFFPFGIIGTTAFTIMMDKSRSEMAATDYTLQTSITPFGGVRQAH
jgi:MFS transporter, PAT family, beta-lactamase induction signal transducer AmpG